MRDLNPVVHFEMGYNDPKRIAKFYESAFGWKTIQYGPELGNYIVAQTAETDDKGMIQTKGAINGGFYKKTEDPSSLAPSFVISVKNINKAIEEVKKAGGKILGGVNQQGEHTMEPQMIPGVGLWISAKDTEDNRFSIMQP